MKELAPPVYLLGGNVVFIGRYSMLDKGYFYSFLHDFASVEADSDTFSAIQDYLYWHSFLKRAVIRT
jgi:hypothetical protein